MTPAALIDELARRKVLLWTDGECLKVRAPKGSLTPELHLELASQKAAVVAALRASRGPRQGFHQIVPCPEKRHLPFPLTDVQRAYWVGRTGAYDLGNVACHAYYEIESSNLNIERFNRALQLLIVRHDMLRAVVLPDGRQQVLEEVPLFQIKVLDLREERPEEAALKLASTRDELSHQVLPADQWPLFDVRISRLIDRVRIHISFDILFLDVRSLQILFKEWRELYQDPAALLVPLDLSFRDYVTAELELRTSEMHRRSRAYWSPRFETLPPGPDLPLNASSAGSDRPRFTRRTGSLDAKSWDRLGRLATDAGLTRSGLLLTAFTEVVAAWSRRPRFTINVTLMNRPAWHPQVDRIVGDFTSLIPLEVDNSGRRSFLERAARIQSQLLEDIEHRHMSGVEIIREATRIQKNQSPVTLPVVFTSLLGQCAASNGGGQKLWMGDVVYGISQTPQVWLDHQVYEEEGTLQFNWDSVDALFPEGMVQDLFDTYCRMLRELSEDQAMWRGTVRRLVPDAQLALREAVNATAMAVPGTLLHLPFCEQASVCPDQVALICGEQAFSYGEIDRLSNQVARRLRSLRLIPGQLVAVVMEKGWEQVVAVLGILKSGAAYLPISPAIPSRRLKHLLEHGEVQVALTQRCLDRELDWPESILRICCDDVTAECGGLLEPVQRPQDLAYVIYTSGSTGTPKGVMIDHRGALNTVLDINRRFLVSPGDRVLAISDLSFDLSVYDIFGTLAAGATIVIPESENTREPSHWLELMEQHRATVWNSVPALMDMLAIFATGNACMLPACLRLVLLSGDWIPVGLPRQLKTIAKQAQIISLGGATEASIWSIYYPIDHVDPGWRSIPYGKPLQNQTWHLLNDAMEPCPVWAVGQLYIGGLGLAQGYWRDQSKTEASFLTHPDTGERLYRTGDLGRYLPDGNIEFLGREDSQIKIQGYRVELGEIESVLVCHPAVRAAAIKVIGKDQQSKRLVAYVVTDRIISLKEELGAFLDARLPSYMRPSAYVAIDSLPLTANGKVDRTALPEPALPAATAEPDPGAGEINNQIAAIVARVLGVNHVESDTDLFELGATSLEIVRLLNLLQQELQWPRKVEDIFRSPTVTTLTRSYGEFEAASNSM